MDKSTTYHTVFVDTSLDTHLALIVSDADTVSDLKEKITCEHPLCFPDFGEIKINALKVKRKGYFYHLTDPMFVRSAFDGVQKNWFVFIDASILVKDDNHNLSSDPGPSNALLCTTNGDTSERFITSKSKLEEQKNNHLLNHKIPIQDNFVPDDSIREVLKDLEVRHVNDSNFSSLHSSAKLLGTLNKCHNDSSFNGYTDLECNIPQSEVISKKKSKKKRKFEALKESPAADSVDESRKGTLGQEITALHNTDKTSKGILNVLGMGNQQSCDEGDNERLKENVVDVHTNASLGETPKKKRKIKKKSKDVINDKEVIAVHPNFLMGEVLEAVAAEKKEHELEKESEDFVNETEAMFCNPNLDTSVQENIIPQNTVASKQGTTTDAHNCLSNEPPQDNNLIYDRSNSAERRKKIKKKISSSFNKIVATIPSSKDDFREETSKETLGSGHNDSCEEPNEAIIHVHSVQVLESVTAEKKECELAKDSEDHVNETEPKICASNLDTFIPQNALASEQGTTTGAHHCLSTEPQGNNFIRDQSSAVKIKKKIKKKFSSSHNENVAAIPSSKDDFREETSKATLVRGHNDSGKEPNGAVIHMHSVQDAMPSELGILSLRENDDNIVQEMRAVPDVILNDKSELNANKSVEKMQSSENNDLDKRLSEKSQPTDQYETEISMKEVFVPLLDATVAVEHEKSANRAKKPKKTKTLDGGRVNASQDTEAEKNDDIPVINQDAKIKKSKKKIIPDMQNKEQDLGRKISSIDAKKKEKKLHLVETGSEKSIRGSRSQSRKEIENKSEYLQSQVGVNVERCGDSFSQGNETFGNIKVTEATIPEKKIEEQKKNEKVDQRSVRISSPVKQVSLKQKNNHGSETESGVDNSNTIQGSLSKPKQIFPKKTGKKVEAPVSAKAARANINNNRKVTTDKASDYILKKRKSLLAISGSIFKDGNDHSSEDDDSGSSTKTPSNNDDDDSSSSSEVGSKTGSQVAKRKSDGDYASTMKNMTLDEIMKSSSRFKKAKIIASQSQYEEELESQPVEFVPDSQPNL